MANAEVRPLLVRMPPDLHKLVQEIAAKEDRTMAAVMREAARAYARKAGVRPA